MSQSPTTRYSKPHFESGDSTTHLSIRRTYLLYALGEPENGALKETSGPEEGK